jgi:hypothetical protein
VSDMFCFSLQVSSGLSVAERLNCLDERGSSSNGKAEQAAMQNIT